MTFENGKWKLFRSGSSASYCTDWCLQRGAVDFEFFGVCSGTYGASHLFTFFLGRFFGSLGLSWSPSGSLKRGHFEGALLLIGFPGTSPGVSEEFGVFFFLGTARGCFERAN